jgi:hypothetical protein
MSELLTLSMHASRSLSRLNRSIKSVSDNNGQENESMSFLIFVYLYWKIAYTNRRKGNLCPLGEHCIAIVTHWFLLSLPFLWQVLSSSLSLFLGNNCAIFHSCAEKKHGRKEIEPKNPKSQCPLAFTHTSRCSIPVSYACVGFFCNVKRERERLN